MSALALTTGSTMHARSARLLLLNSKPRSCELAGRLLAARSQNRRFAKRVLHLRSPSDAMRFFFERSLRISRSPAFNRRVHPRCDQTFLPADASRDHHRRWLANLATNSQTETHA